MTSEQESQWPTNSQTINLQQMKYVVPLGHTSRTMSHFNYYMFGIFSYFTQFY